MGSKATTPLAVGGGIGVAGGAALAITAAAIPLHVGWMVAGIFIGCVGLACMSVSVGILTS